MTLRKKTLLVTSITLLGLIAVSYVVSSTILLHSFADLEQQNTTRNVSRALEALNDSISNLNKIVGDWAFWDDMYAFVEDVNPEFIKANFTGSTFSELQLNLIAVVNSSRGMVFSKAFDLTGEQEVPFPSSMLQHLSSNALLLQHPDDQSSHTGLIQLPEGVMLVASRPILTSEGEGPVRGALIMGRYLDSDQINHLAETTHLNLTFYGTENDQMPADFSAAKKALSEQDPIFIKPLNANSIAGYIELRDIYGQLALLLRVDLPRDILSTGSDQPPPFDRVASRHRTGVWCDDFASSGKIGSFAPGPSE